MRDKSPNLTDYEKTYREFKSEIPEYYNFGFDGIDRWAEDRTKLALISVDDGGKELPSYEEGYVALKVKPFRPPGLMLEYWKNPEAMEKAFRGDWYFTGDKAYRDEEGYFWFIGRDKELIKTVGQSVAPLEIEKILLEHPAVMDAAVIGIPDEKLGETIKTFVQLKPAYQPSEKLSKEILGHVGRNLEPQKHPKELEFLRELPKTTTGKIRRSELKNREIEKRSGR